MTQESNWGLLHCRQILYQLSYQEIQYFNIQFSSVAQSYLTPSDLSDCSLLGAPIHGIFQARVLEWGAIAVSF